MRASFAFLLSVGLCGQAPLIPVQQRKDVAAFTVQDVDRQRFTSVADARGRVVVVGALVRWAPLSRALAKELQWLQLKEKAVAIKVLPVFRVRQGATTEPERRAQSQEMQQSAAKNQNDFDPDDPAKEYLLPIGFHAYLELDGAKGRSLDLFPPMEKPPAAYLIDRRGRLACVLPGYQKGLLTKTAQALLDEPEEPAKPAP